MLRGEAAANRGARGECEGSAAFATLSSPLANNFSYFDKAAEAYKKTGFYIKEQIYYRESLIGE